MKKQIYFLSALILIGSIAIGQNILNSSFENWTTDTAYNSPDNMETMNLQGFFINGSGNTNKSIDAHQGNYSARMESVQNGSATLIGMINNGLYDGQTASGGVPYSSKPDSVYFWVKYNVMPGDTAAVAFFFKKISTVYGAGYQFFTGQSNTWTRIGIPITYQLPINPDSIIFMAVSSNPNGVPFTGSVLYVDDIQFSGGAPTIPNGAFENWTAATFEQPDDWFAYSFVNLFLDSPYVEKSTDAFHGNYSIKLTTRIEGGDTFAFFSNGDISNDDWDQGKPVNWDPMKLTGYYKSIPIANDTAAIAVRTTRWDAAQSKKIITEEQLIKLGPTTVWMPFEINFKYNSHQAPVDTLQLAFGASNLINGQINAANGSQLWIDSLNLQLYPLGINNSVSNTNLIKVFPNPASEQINFQFEGDLMNSPKKLIVFDAQSKKQIEINSSNSVFSTIDISQLAAGIYFYIIESNQKIYNGKFSVR